MALMPDRSKVVLRYILESSSKIFPGNECVLFENGDIWTYEQALMESYKSANVLSESGIKQGNKVMILLPNSPEWLRAWWGTVSLGAIIVPLNTAYKGEILRHACVECDGKYIITNSELAGRIADLGLNLTVIDASLLAEGPVDEPKLEKPMEPWDTHAIIYTSGTTGPSKGVILTNYRIYKSSYLLWERALRGNDTMLVDLPLFHISGIGASSALLSVGGRFALRTKFSGTNYMDIIRKSGATLAYMIGTIPYFLEESPRRPDDSDNPLRVIFCAPLPKDLAGFMKRFGIEEVENGFGMTELHTVLCQCLSLQRIATCNAPINSPKCCGKISPGYELRLVDDNDIPVTTGETGELIVRADLPWDITPGYYGRPLETAQAWRNGWFHTGDMFYCDEEGYYFFVDRKKDSIRRRGENISSSEVEQQVMLYPSVIEVACVPVPGEFGEDEVKVYIVPRENSNLDPEDLIRFLIPRMPYFMIPRFIDVVDRLPKTPTMRVKNFELRARGNSSTTWDREASGISVNRNS